MSSAQGEALLQATRNNRSFSHSIPGSQTAIDSTSLGTFKVCPRMYYYSVIQGWTPRDQSVHLTFGLLVHQGLERYDHAVVKGADHAEALRATVRWALEATWNRTLGRPWISNDPNKNRVTLLRSLVWYLDQFGPNDPLQTITLASGKPAVELSFSFDIGWTTPSGGEAVIACGHLDRLAMFEGEPVIADRKTTKGALSPSWFNKFSPGNQFSMYTLAGRLAFDLPVRKLVVDGMQVLVSGTRFQRGLVVRTDSQVEEWLGETHWWLGQMDDCAVRQHWPQNDRSCLAGDTTVKITRGKFLGKRIRLDALYKMLNVSAGPRFDPSIPTFVLADLGGHAGLNRLLGVLQQGVKPVTWIYTSHGALKATLDHKFKTPHGWLQLSELSVGDQVHAWGGGQATGRVKQPVREVKTGLLYHPYGQAWRGKEKRLTVYRLAYEAHMNGLRLEDYVSILKSKPDIACNLQFLPHELQVHHKDGDITNNSLSNLEVVNASDHGKLHSNRFQQVTRKLELVQITKLEYAGEEQTYDLQMEAPFHNFLANSLVVHNCDQYGGCVFRDVCARPVAAREQWLNATFTKRVWDPLERRGDV